METIKVKVDSKFSEIIEGQVLRSGSYNIDKFVFEFSEEYEGLVKKALIILPDGTSLNPTIIDNELTVPVNLYDKSYIDKNITIGVYAYSINENEELELRYSPKPFIITPRKGSYDEDAVETAEDIQDITPTDLEIYYAKFNEIYNSVLDMRDEINAAVTEANNINISAEKENKTTTVTITKKDGTTETVQINDGQDRTRW